MTSPCARVHIGTSGWSYAYWKGTFYPERLPDRQLLEYYAQQFRSVEINSAFYRLPEPQTLRHWYDSTPDDFVFGLAPYSVEAYLELARPGSAATAKPDGTGLTLSR